MKKQQVIIINGVKALIYKGAILNLTVCTKNGVYMVNITSPLFEGSGVISAVDAKLFLYAAKDYIMSAYSVNKHEDFDFAFKMLNVLKAKNEMQHYRGSK